MAVTQNTYTGNGSTVLFSFTFPYLTTADIKVSVNGVNTTAYTLATPTTIQFTVAPGNGAAIRIYRATEDEQTKSTFFPGSSIRAEGLNDNFLQLLYVVQEAEALAVETDVKSTAAQAAVADAATQASIATTSANVATALANTAITQATTATNTANSTTAVAASAVTTANSAVTTANSAVTTANSATNTANQAIAAISNSIAYTLVANVAAIPATPANNTYVEVQNSTGIESFSPLAGLPGGFVGDAGLSVRINYTSAGTTWNWLSYAPNNAETRYLKIADVENSVTSTNTAKAAASSAVKTAYDAAVSAQSAATAAQSTANTAQSTANSKYGSADLATQAEAEAGSSSTKLMTPQRVAQAVLALPTYVITTTAVSKTLVNRERCTVTADGITIALPASPAAGAEVAITVVGAITNTIIARNGQNIMSLAENFTIDRGDVTVTLYYVDATRGWRII